MKWYFGFGTKRKGTKAKVSELEIHKTEKFLHRKMSLVKWKGNIGMGEDIGNHISNKVLISKLYKELAQLNRKITSNLIFK